MNNQSATMNTKDNPLGYKKESTLLVGFAIPCIISMLVTALYNIVDQIFIGQGIGMLGNAATNIAFPLSTTCTAISLLLGIGSATNFSLYLGAGEKNESEKYAGNGIVLMALFGIFLFLVTTIFLTPMLKFFGATKDVLPYAKAYTRITAFGFPFLIANTGMSKLILADGSPRYSMISMLAGAIVNTILDPLFIFVFNMGMTGAALATITGQIISFSISLRYMFHFKTIKLSRESFIVSAAHCKKIFILGASACFNQIAMTVVQIVMNNTLSHYGAQSIYGGDIPLACAGIITKVNMIFMSFVIGISQGTQPVIGPAYITPLIPMNIGNIIISGSRKIICLVSDMNTPSCDLPIELKKLEVTGWIPFTIVRNIYILKYLSENLKYRSLPLPNMLIICLGNIWKHANAIKDRAEAAPSARR